MQKVVICAICSMQCLFTTFAHADPKAAAIQAIAIPQAEISVQAQRADRLAVSTRKSADQPNAVQAIASLAGPTDSPSTTGMLLGALAIMAVVARRRWHTFR